MLDLIYPTSHTNIEIRNKWNATETERCWTWFTLPPTQMSKSETNEMQQRQREDVGPDLPYLPHKYRNPKEMKCNRDREKMLDLILPYLPPKCRNLKQVKCSREELDGWISYHSSISLTLTSSYVSPHKNDQKSWRHKSIKKYWKTLSLEKRTKYILILSNTV